MRNLTLLHIVIIDAANHDFAIVFYVVSGHNDLSVIGIVETHKKLYERRLSRSVVTYKSDLFTGLYVDVYIFKQHLARLIVSKRKVLYRYVFGCAVRFDVAKRFDLRLVLKEISDLLHVKARLARKRICVREYPKASLHTPERVVKYGNRGKRKRSHNCCSKHQVCNVNDVAEEIVSDVITYILKYKMALRVLFLDFQHFFVGFVEIVVKNARYIGI